MASRATKLSIIFVFLGLVSPFTLGGSLAGPAKPAGLSDGETIFNVLQFGAQPGTKRESTEAFMQAWNAACSFNGRARLYVPPGVFTLGETFFQGPCKCQTPFVVQIVGTVKAVSDLSSYSGGGWISFDSVEGLVLTGGGTFDGQGQSVWKYNDCKTNPDCVHLPATLYFNGMNNTKVKGLNLINSMGFHLHVTCSNVFRAHSLTITSPPNSPNTDGLHISRSHTVKFSRSTISTGDDCVSIGQGGNNITLTKITCGPGHGISIGSLGKLPNEMDVRGVIVKNCTLVGTTNGLRIKTYPNTPNPSRASGMLFTGILMENVQNPIIIDQNYGIQSDKPSLVKISDVIYQNIRGTTAKPVAVNLMCSSQVPCHNIRFIDINLKLLGGTSSLSALCNNAQVGYSGINVPPPCRLL